MSSRDPLERLAIAAERIADALEFLSRTVVPAGPAPQLKVARAPSDTSRMEPVTLRAEEGVMTAILQNVGDGDTVVTRPSARLGAVEVVGELLDRDSRPQPSLPVPAAPDGPGVIAQFGFERRAHILGDLSLVLRFPHRPGLLPMPSVLEVEFEPSGASDGRYQWRATDSRVVRDHDGAA
jgi:hypothetical protein